jgi:uncharacterized cupin superfamily protein
MQTINIVRAENVEGRIDVGRAVGSSETAMYVYDLDPGSGLSPYHYEYVEEWLLVVRGELTVRQPGGLRTIAAGDLVRFPAGPDGAHKAMNRSDVPARLLIWSSARVPAVTVYPDSDKIGVFPTAGGEADHFFTRDTQVEWAHGEEGWNRSD